MTRMIIHTAKKNEPPFNKMELKIIKLLYKQYTNAEIAENLEKSIRTIEGYRKGLLEKTKSRNSVGIILYALKKGICKI
jgi:DNA-binding CsgD family transcriptional regulator